MKKIVKVVLFSFGLFVLSVLSLPFLSNSASSQTIYTFNPKEDKRSDIAVQLGCGALYSLSLGDYELRPHEYCFSSGTLTIYKSFLLSLGSGQTYTFCAQTEGGETDIPVRVREFTSLMNFGQQGNDGWYYKYIEKQGVSFDIDESKLGDLQPNILYGVLVDFQIGSDIRVSSSHIYVNSNKVPVLKWQAPATGKYTVRYRLEEIQNNGCYLKIYKGNNILYQNYLLCEPDNGITEYAEGDLENVELNAGQCLYFAFVPYEPINNNWRVYLNIFCQPFKVDFAGGDEVFSQYVYPGQRAEYFEPYKEGAEFKGWFLDEELTVPYDFAYPVASDLTLYAGWEESFDFDAQLAGGQIAITVRGDSAAQYQVWIKSSFPTDASSDKSRQGYQWEMARSFSNKKTISIDAEERYFIDGQCQMIVRLRKGNLIEDLFKTFSFDRARIESIEVDGKPLTGGMAVVQRPDPFTVKAGGGPPSALYILTANGVQWTTSADGEFALDSQEFAGGVNLFAVEVWDEEGLGSSKEFTIYFYESYNAGQTPVILSLEGETAISGYTEFKMKLAFADRSDIPAGQAGVMDISLSVEGNKAVLADCYNDGEGKFTALFKITLPGHGIYRAVGQAAPKGRSQTDTIIYYYKGYARQAFLEQQASSFEAQAGNTVKITANGWIKDEKDGYLYAYYREDASGWNLIRDYSSDPALNWTPLNPGRYNIECRIKGVGEGSYEKSAGRTYTILGPMFEGTLSLKITDLLSGQEVKGGLVAGRPYLFKAEAESEEVLFMYTLTTINLGTVYLNKYSPDGALIFVPNKQDEFTITLRAINWQNYGFKDVDLKVKVTGVI